MRSRVWYDAGLKLLTAGSPLPGLNLQVRIWHATTYRAETTLNYGMERVWALAASKDSNKCVVGVPYLLTLPAYWPLYLSPHGRLFCPALLRANTH